MVMSVDTAKGLHLVCNRFRSKAVSSSTQSEKHQKFEALIDTVAADLYRFAIWRCRDKLVAEELIQETYIRVWKSIHTLRDVNSAKSWVFTIFRREYARQFERKKLTIVDLDSLEWDSIRAVSDNQVDTIALRKAFRSLDEKYTEPLLLQVLGGFGCREISEVLGISETSVMTRLFRARKQLRQYLSDDVETTNKEAP
ncbi:MAG: RNA polymerase sigma-70 factor (ECF subfamily) [Gammaproteobacteria bacterium]